MTVTTVPHWYTVTQAADHTGLSATTLRKEIDAGNLQARRIGRCLRITDVELRRWMLGESSTVGPVVGSASDTASAPLRGPAHGGVS